MLSKYFCFGSWNFVFVQYIEIHTLHYGDLETSVDKGAKFQTDIHPVVDYFLQVFSNGPHEYFRKKYLWGSGKKNRICAGWIFVIMLGVHLCIFSFFKFAYLFPILLDRREPIAGGMGLGSLN